MKKLMLIALAAMLAIPFVGCKKEETIGDKIDAAVDSAKKEADKAVDKAAEAVKNATK